MTTASVRGPAAPAGRRSAADRFVAAVPYAVLGLALAVLYLVEAWSRRTPWLFSDEIEWTQISRSIAATGHAARRGDPTYFKSLYAYLIAPFWWIGPTGAAYGAIKAANAVVMALAAVPTYLLARMLVSRRSAGIVALGSIVAPAMAYSTSIVPEVLAYPYYALCSLLAVRAYRSGGRRDAVLATVFAVGGLVIRQNQFYIVPATLALGAAGLWLTGPRGRGLRRSWTRWDTVGAAVLALGAFYLFNRVVLQSVYQWQHTTQYYRHRMFSLGFRAGLSLAIGLGLLPVIGGLVSLRLPERRGDRTYRAFVAWSASSIFVMVLYTADKAAFLSTNFGTLWEERDMIYLTPLLLIGTAMVFEATRVDRLVAAAAAALVVGMVAFTAVQTGYPYYDAPGSAIPAVLHVYEGWNGTGLRFGLLGLAAVSIALLACRRRRLVAGLSAAFVLVWMLSGEISMTVGIDHQADHFVAYLPAPPTPHDWIDRATGGKPVTYLGEGINDANPILTMEFWNRSIHHVDSLDGSAPGPGPSGTPGILSPSGVLAGYASYPYVLADNGVTLDAPVVATNGKLVLYRKRGPWRLVDSEDAVFTDGWCSSYCAYTYFVPHQQGTLVVTLSRTAYNGTAPAGKVTLDVGHVVLDENHNPVLGPLVKVDHTLIANATEKTIDIPVAQTPVRVDVHIPNTFVNPPDARQLGAVLSFKFVPR